MGLFLKAVVVDGNGDPLENAIGKIYDINDTANAVPLTVTDLSGNPMALDQVIANNDGVTPDFKVPGRVLCKWVSGPYTIGMIAADLVPPGGSPGQVLAKNTSGDYDTTWISPGGVALGGTDGQVLLKDGTTPFATRWGDAPAGTSSGGSTGGTTTTVFASGSVAFVRQDALGNWPVRPTSLDNVLVIWVGVDSWPAIVTSGVNGPHAGDLFIEKRTS